MSGAAERPRDARRRCAPSTSAALERVDGDELFHARFARFFTELRDPLVALYGDDPRFAGAVAALLDAIARHRGGAPGGAAPCSTTSARSRPTGCSASRRSATSPTSTASRGTLAGVRERLRYLRELGVSYLHLMPLLQARPEPNDGGYAVADYGAVEPALGHDGRPRARSPPDLRAAGMALCIDVVLNHTAREHAWAQAALAGDARQARATTGRSPDRTEPDAYERTLPEVFPDIAPGNFTWVPELDRWVWTTFNDYQWDLDYTNPEVFRAMAEVDARPRGRRRRRAAPRRRAVPVEARSARTARTSPRSTSCCRRSAR